jgi:hypothetical protein
MVIKRTIVASAVTALFSMSPIGWADDIQDIRNEIKAIKDSYESRIKALEDRLKDAEAKAEKAETSAAKAESKAQELATAPAPRAPTGQNAFNPGISLILSGFYKNLSRDPDVFPYRIGGFFPSGDEVGPGGRGFSLSESELSIAANIDQLFYGQLTASLTPEDTVAVEEAFFKTLALPAGFSIKGGRFFSGIGYLNEVHAHAWDFADQPLAYQAFLGGQYGQNGLQAKWLAPTPIFLEFGAEVGSGQNFPGQARNKNGGNGGAGFFHVGGDFGDSTSWRAGLSHLYHRVKDRDPFADESGTFGGISNQFSGKSNLTIADFVLKWAPNGNPVETNFKIQGEYFHRKEKGDLVFDVNGDPNVDPFAATASTFSSAQSGWYLQGVYQFLPQWRVGLRYDELDSGSPSIGLIGQTDPGTGITITEDDFGTLKQYKPKRSTVMFDWNPSEFTRIRLQYAQDKARRDLTDNQFFIQYIYSLGAHGAHKF